MLLCVIKWCNHIQYYNGFCENHYDFYFWKVFWEYRTSHPLYSVRKHIIYRCTKKSCANYKYYGERWIKVCDRRSWPQWFRNFIVDMWNRPDWCSVDRIDCDGPYSPENCKRSNHYEQQANTRNQIWKETWVTRRKNNSKWQAIITFKWKRISLWMYKQKDKAIEIRKKAETICTKSRDKNIAFVLLTLNDLKREYKKRCITY